MRRNLRGILFMVLVMLLTISLTTWAEDKLVIVGFSDGDIEVTAAALKALPTVTKDVVSVNSSGTAKKFSITGPTFADLLAKFDKSQSSLEAIRFVAGDGYSIEVPAEVLQNRQIILAYLMDGEPLDEKSQPVRAVIPEERAMYWVRNLVKIEILGVDEQVAVERVHFLETAVGQLETVDYTYYESLDQAVSVQDLLTNLAMTDDSSIQLRAVDGLNKSEDQKIFSNGYIKVTGTDVPLFLSPEIPKGMYVKHILHFIQADAAVISMTKALEGLEQTTLDDIEGINVVTILDALGVVKNEIYRLIADDGYFVEVNAADLSLGIIYLDDKGQVRSYFSGLPKNTGVKGLLTIEAVK